jgi:hypothetical protein
MSNFIIEAGQPIPEPMPEQQQVFTIKYTKVVKDLKGNDVTVIDEQRTETVTKEQLEAQKLQHQKMISELEEKLARIEEM